MLQLLYLSVLCPHSLVMESHTALDENMREECVETARSVFTVCSFSKITIE